VQEKFLRVEMDQRGLFCRRVAEQYDGQNVKIRGKKIALRLSRFTTAHRNPYFLSEKLVKPEGAFRKSLSFKGQKNL
jgi:hypothetical protein